MRELHVGSIPQSSWVNQHLVYTHGYGIVAAPTDEVDPKTASPVFLNGGIPPSQEIPVTRPQVYFSPAFGSSSYAIAGQPAGSSTEPEFDHPGGKGSSKSAYTAYRGGGGIPIGSTLRRLLFAVQNGDPNIFFSSELNSASQLLTVRDPRARVAAMVAPWLTLDGDVYPAVVDGQIKWIVDGYTSSSNYPDSQLVNLHRQHDDVDRQRRVDLAAEHAGELPAELGEGRRRCVHRQGDAVLVEPGATPGPAAHRRGNRRSPAWSSRSPASRQPCCRSCATRPICSTCSATLLTKYHVTSADELLQRQRLLEGADRPDGRVLAGDQRDVSVDAARRARRCRRGTARCPPTGSARSAIRCPARW